LAIKEDVSSFTYSWAFRLDKGFYLNPGIFLDENFYFWACRKRLFHKEVAYSWSKYQHLKVQGPFWQI
jgi:hypothetical protein